jgi:hypothetical protein
MKSLIVLALFIPCVFFAQENQITITKNNGNIEDIQIFENQQITFPTSSNDDVIYISLKNGSIDEFRLSDVKSIIFDQTTDVDEFMNDITESGNYPNPFSENTSINYYLDKETNVQIIIFDIRGNVIKSFNSELQGQGLHCKTWDGKSSSGEKICDGVYYFQVKTQNQVLTKPLMIVR